MRTFLLQPDPGTLLLQFMPPCLRPLLRSGKLSKRQLTVLAMEHVAYNVRWVVGEPIIVQDPSCKPLLSTEDEHFILQYARASQLDRPAASTQPSGSEKAFQQATKGAALCCDTSPHALGVGLACHCTP
jgi:hypothetical protein